MQQSTQSKRAYLRRIVSGKQQWSAPLPDETKSKGFKGWHERGYLPHCDKPGLTQFVTFRLWDSMPSSRRGEWEHLLSLNTRRNAPRSEVQSIAEREQRIKLEEYLDRSLGKCFLRNPTVANIVETAMLHQDGRAFRMLAWVIMPNHVHALIEVGEVPLFKIIQNWKSITAVEANKVLGRNGRLWQPEYWDRFMRNEEQKRKAVRYIENNPVKAKLCRAPEDWPFSSARSRDPQTRELKPPERGASPRANPAGA